MLKPLTLAALAVMAASLPMATPTIAKSKTACAANATAPWSAAGKGWTIEATAEGRSCDQATATITIRDSEGAPQWAETYSVDQVMVLAGASSPADLEDKILEWVGPLSSTFRTTADLPDWPEGTDGPGGEFPFMPDEGLDRSAYGALRSAKAPVFCYVQGMESLACVMADKASGKVTLLGLQMFPG